MLVAIPGVGAQDVAVIQGLLRHGGFFFRVHNAVGDGHDLILIREADLPAIKAFLSHYRIRCASGDTSPIPW